MSEDNYSGIRFFSEDFLYASQRFSEALKPIYNVFEMIGNIVTTLSEIKKSGYFQDFISVVQELKNNPYSLLNYANYKQKLNNFHWAWPFEFDEREIKNLLENVHNEKEFDEYLCNYFSVKKVDRLMNRIVTLIPYRHKTIFKQICNAYKRGEYAICNNSMMTIIDNLLSDYLLDKGSVKRYEMFKPIIDILIGTNIFNVPEKTFEFYILSNNIDFIFEKHDFNNKIMLDTNKKVRRHLSIHGFKYSNQKIDALMLMNSIYELLSMNDFLKAFKNSLLYDKKSKTIVLKSTTERKIYKPIIKEWILECLNDNNRMTRKEIVVCLWGTDKKYKSFNMNHISKVLQEMKNKDNTIICETENGVSKWSLNVDGIERT